MSPSARAIVPPMSPPSPSSSLFKFATHFLLPASALCYLTHSRSLVWPSVSAVASDRLRTLISVEPNCRRESGKVRKTAAPLFAHIMPHRVVGNVLLGLRAKTSTSVKANEFPNINSMQTDDAAAYLPQGPNKWKPAFNFQEHVEEAWRHWHDLGSPRFMMAPMVDQSELAFRHLGRKYGCDLCYTPMLHSKMFATSDGYRKDSFETTEHDRPLVLSLKPNPCMKDVVQFCGNNPSTLLDAARRVEGQCDAVDLNLGCPQGIAKKGRYGAFLMEDWDRIHDMVLTLKQSLAVPVWAKVRVFPDMDQTIAYVKMIEAAGASVIAVHGRTRDQKGNNPGPPDWEAIRAVKEALSVPVIANGGVSSLADAEACLAATRCDALMSACGLLQTPTLFAGKEVEPVDIAAEYLEIADRFQTKPRFIQPHLFCMLRPLLSHRPDLLASLASFRHRPGAALDTYTPFLNLVTRQVGRLEDAKRAQGLPAPDINEQHLDELTSLGVSREMTRSAYKQWQRKQRKKVQVGDVTERLESDADVMDPFHACSLFYHVLGKDDPYGEETLKAAHAAAVAEGKGGNSGKGFGRFLVRKSNSEPLTCVTVSYIEPGGEVYHVKVQRVKQDGKPGDTWRLKWDDDGTEIEREHFKLDSLLKSVLIPKNIHGVEPRAVTRAG